MIFCDLDEVFADFTGSALELHGISRETLEEKRKPGSWDITGPLGIEKREFWKPIREKGCEFWSGVKPLPWYRELLNLLKNRGEFRIVTSVGSGTLAERVGKLHWAAKYLGLDLDHLFFARDKSFFAKFPGAVLIDDKEEHVQKFQSAGGRGILFPSYGNMLHIYANNPLPYLYLD